MEFTLMGQKHVFRGVTKPTSKLVKGSSLNRLMLQGPQIALVTVRNLPDSDTDQSGTISHISTIGNDMSSPTWDSHIQHFHYVFLILQQNQLYLKLSKCTFGATCIEYLGHFYFF